MRISYFFLTGKNNNCIREDTLKYYQKGKDQAASLRQAGGGGGGVGRDGWAEFHMPCSLSLIS